MTGKRLEYKFKRDRLYFRQRISFRPHALLLMYNGESPLNFFKRINRQQFASLLGASLLLMLATRAVEADFAHDIMPVLKQHCGKCHTGQKKEGGFSMNTRAEFLAGGENGKVVIAGKAAKSHLIELITSTDEDTWMPPEGPRVPAAKVAILRKWIDAGMPWEADVTLGTSSWEPPLKPRRVALPPAQNGRDHPIDRLLDAYLAKNKQPAPNLTSDAAFLRRATLDANGLLPSPAELQAFVADTNTNKREQLIDKLLADDIAYADHWLTTWNDLLRNDYTGTGFITGGRSQITTWLYAALRNNKPYDEVVRELISPSKDSAGFINGIQWRGEVNASQTREIQFAQNVSQVFLGINMKCASCHDSFIDRWTLSEAYNLAAIFSDHTLELNRCDKPTGKMATPKWIFPEIGDVDPKAPKDQRLKQLGELMTHPENGRFTRTLVNRIWNRLMGRGIVHPVDAMHTKPWNEDLLDYLAVRFAEDGYDLRKFIRFVMTSQAYQSQAMVLKSEPGEDYVYAGPIAKRMTAEQLIDSIWQITGTNPARAEAKADRTEVKKEPHVNAAAAVKPLKLFPITAKWIWAAGPISPTAKFRKTFKLTSKPKSAIAIMTCDNAFTMKVNGKQVATSKEWQIPVRSDIAAQLRDGENTIEVDGAMFGGSAGFICQLAMVDANKQLVITTDKTWEAQKPDGQWHAAAELSAHGAAPWGAVLTTTTPSSSGQPSRPVRAALVKNDFLMRSLGRPHRDQVVTTRPGELTTLQAIDLSNGDILAGYLSAGGRNIVGQAKSKDELIEWLYRYALSRVPTAGERAVLADVAGDGRNAVAVEDLLWSVFMLPEFQIIR